MILFFLINVITYLTLLKINYIFFDQKMYYPFRIAEINTFILNNIFILSLIFIFFEVGFVLLIFFINCLLSWIIYHLANMVQTSPRTKILLDLYNYQKINKNKYINTYTIDTILNNRLERFISSNQIQIKNNFITISNKSNTFLKLVFNIFKIIKYF